MALSEAEQRLLDELEKSLMADDPSFVEKLSTKQASPVSTKRVAIAVTGVVCGLILLVVGMMTRWYISVGGFAVMLAAVTFLLATWSSPMKRPASGPGSAPRQPASATIMETLERRWRDRQEGNR
ncbi:MAG: DUF3040 domain-containing protein [Propionibacteriaceae bacterium]|jgi:uncharacterized membrane protein YphA (DoxX/SURF4 family)|nr:DUF3040 domain-containing protein [Propionibacteriaceae bacterium]